MDTYTPTRRTLAEHGKVPAVIAHSDTATLTLAACVTQGRIAYNQHENTRHLLSVVYIVYNSLYENHDVAYLANDNSVPSNQLQMQPNLI